MNRRKILFIIMSLIMTGASLALPQDKIELPPGFEIEIYAENLPGARSLALSPNGTLFVGTKEQGKVYSVHDGITYSIADGLNMPNGVAFRDGDLYVAEIGRILRFPDIEERLSNPPEPDVVNQDLPKDEHHGWKFIRFGPDGWLYVPVGAPCNVCARGDPYASILRMKPDGSSLEIFARGVRNTVGFDWHPVSRELWFTDNGRDLLGDNLPPDELNRASKAGLNFGFPYVYGNNIPDPQFGKELKMTDFTPPDQELGPHVASLGMRFYTGKMFPDEYRDQIFIAEHGSWNRSEPIGYRISLVRLKDNRPYSYEIFAQGWLQNGRAFGRPVDIEILPDGSLLVSDDLAGVIYRIFYANENRG
ncbi:MAG: sorbosone dehydrogenase family protein [Candidatus Margulisbacteria bacterium]|nr:sorbosone dehydrogenase family protein [Candidatus Margulisiibacteriota bacterium]